jgi:hypothetical protein
MLLMSPSLGWLPLGMSGAGCIMYCSPCATTLLNVSSRSGGSWTADLAPLRRGNTCQFSAQVNGNIPILGDAALIAISISLCSGAFKEVARR